MFKLRILAKISIFFVFVCFSACGHEIVKDTNTYDSTAFHIAVLPIEECDAFRRADSLGLYDSLGIKVQLLEYESLIDEDTALLANYIDMMVCDSVHREYINKRMPVKQVMTGRFNLSLMMNKESVTSKITELKNKLVACARNSVDWYFMDKIANRANLQTKDVNRPLINNIRIRTTMLLANQYNGAMLPEPWATMCEEKGAKRIFKCQDINAKMLSVIVPDSTWKHKQKKINLIIKAYELASK